MLRLGLIQSLEFPGEPQAVFAFLALGALGRSVGLWRRPECTGLLGHWLSGGPGSRGPAATFLLKGSRRDD